MKPHWSIRYLFDRTREWIFHKTNPNAPWLGPAAVTTLDKLLMPHFVGVEAGAGRSTRWLAKRVAHLTSLEENEVWLERVVGMLRRDGLQNVDMKRVLASDEGLRANYLEAIAVISDNSLDFATVDSEHERATIALGLLSKLKPGGFLMLDNANWFIPSSSRSPSSRSISEGPLDNGWRKFVEETEDWRFEWTSSGVTDTAFFFKPASASTICLFGKF